MVGLLSLVIGDEGGGEFGLGKLLFDELFSLFKGRRAGEN